MPLGPGPSVPFPHAHSVEQYIIHKGSQHDEQRVIALPKHLKRLSISHDHDGWDTVTSAWRKQWNI